MNIRLPSATRPSGRARHRAPVSTVVTLSALLALGACDGHHLFDGDDDDDPPRVVGEAGAVETSPDTAVSTPPDDGPPAPDGGSDGESDAEPGVVQDPESSPPDAVVARADVVDVDGVYPYRPGGRHAAVLADCALVEDSNDGCPLSTLPFIAQETATPGVEDVLERLLVTHDWMGDRFASLLERRGAELLPLFGSVTSIVIGSTVRPSYYWTGTGGIQLDPDGLWLTVGEKANVSIEEDYRASFRGLLDFRNLSTTRVDGRSIYGRFDLEDDGERTFEDIERPMTSLLLHELAHANDFLPPNAAARLDRTLAPASALEEIFDAWLSPDLDARVPLNSSLLRGLAQVRFRGDAPTDAQGTVSGTVAGAEMADDGATHFYNYLTIREDFANLFETLQMKRLFDADVHVAYTAQPEDPENVECADLVVEWGVMNRLGNPTVLARAADVTRSIQGPDPTLDAFLATQENTEVAMEPGLDWCTNLVRDQPPSTPRRRDDATGLAGIVPDGIPPRATRHAHADPLRTVR